MNIYFPSSKVTKNPKQILITLKQHCTDSELLLELYGFKTISSKRHGQVKNEAKSFPCMNMK